MRTVQRPDGARTDQASATLTRSGLEVAMPIAAARASETRTVSVMPGRARQPQPTEGPVDAGPNRVRGQGPQAADGFVNWPPSVRCK